MLRNVTQIGLHIWQFLTSEMYEHSLGELEMVRCHNIDHNIAIPAGT